jgi:small subunit ribosomal protein S1
MGTVLSLDREGAIVDLGLKRDAFVPQSDLDQLSSQERETIQVGAEVPVYIVRPEDDEGNLIASFHQALLNQDWLVADRYLQSGDVWEGRVVGTNRGGLIVKFGDIRGFVPASHVTGLPQGLTEEERHRRLQSMVGQTFGFKVIEVHPRQRLVLSQREAEREYRGMRKDRLLADLAEGQVRHGVVTGLRDFGAFVDLGGADGLIHISEVSWGRLRHPREALKVGQEVDVYVLRVEPDRKRIALSLKHLQPNPWTDIEERYYVGQLVAGTVTRLTNFGAFSAIEPGLEGLLHVSQISSPPPAKPEDVLKENDQLVLRIISIEPGEQRIGLSLKDVSERERERFLMKQEGEEPAPDRAGLDEPQTQTAR